MLPPLKLNAIEQEHLQELYDAAGVARDELPYTDKFDELWQGFQDRTFKNAQREQVFGAILKYVRSSGNPSTDQSGNNRLSDEQAKQLKSLLSKSGKAGNLLPYSDEVEAIRKDFNKQIGAELNEREFWQAMQQAQGPKRRPPKRAKAAAETTDDADEDGE
jgi:hypothetical protein